MTEHTYLPKKLMLNSCKVSWTSSLL